MDSVTLLYSHNYSIVTHYFDWHCVVIHCKRTELCFNPKYICFFIQGKTLKDISSHYSRYIQRSERYPAFEETSYFANVSPEQYIEKYYSLSNTKQDTITNYENPLPRSITDDEQLYVSFLHNTELTHAYYKLCSIQ